MSRVGRIAFLLTLGLSLIGGGVWLAWRQAPGRGRPAEATATIAGIWLRAPAGTIDVLAGHRVTYHLERADGTRVEAGFEGGAPTETTAEPALTTALQSVVGRDLAEHRRLLRVLAREQGWQRLRIEERVTGWFALSAVPAGWHWREGGVAPAGVTEPPMAQVTRIEITWQGGARELGARDTISRFERERAGQPAPPARRDLAAYADGYETSRWPLARFNTPGGIEVVSGDIGRRGAPHALFAWYSETEVRFDPQQPGNARLVARVPTPPRELGRWLRWFSRASEATLYRWAYPLVLLGTGAGTTVIALVLISLALRPSRRQSADTAS